MVNPQLAQVDIMEGEHSSTRVDFHRPAKDPGLDRSFRHHEATHQEKNDDEFILLRLHGFNS